MAQKELVGTRPLLSLLSMKWIQRMQITLPKASIPFPPMKEHLRPNIFCRYLQCCPSMLPGEISLEFVFSGRRFLETTQEYPHSWRFELHDQGLPRVQGAIATQSDHNDWGEWRCYLIKMGFIQSFCSHYADSNEDFLRNGRVFGTLDTLHPDRESGYVRFGGQDEMGDRSRRRRRRGAYQSEVHFSCSIFCFTKFLQRRIETSFLCFVSKKVRSLSWHFHFRPCPGLPKYETMHIKIPFGHPFSPTLNSHGSTLVAASSSIIEYLFCRTIWIWGKEGSTPQVFSNLGAKSTVFSLVHQVFKLGDFFGNMQRASVPLVTSSQTPLLLSISSAFP